MRVGIGYDIHKFGGSKPLVLGGVAIDGGYGVIAHSDGDLLLHSVMDSILGAIAMGDIGSLFPPSEEKFRDADSKELLKIVLKKLDEKKFKIENVDCNIIAQKPKLSPYQEKIKTSLAKLLKIEEGRVNVKIRSNEGCDSIGHGEAISAQAVTSIKEIGNYS